MTINRCETCKYWEPKGPAYVLGDCAVPVPESAWPKRQTYQSQGTSCQYWKRKDSNDANP